jgi:hypothetical protein
LTLVDRPSLARVVQELALNEGGVVNPEQATKLGGLVGAKLLVSGKAFVIGEQTFITAKIVGTETTLVDGVLVKGEKLDLLIDELAKKLGARLLDKGPKLIAADDDGVATDPFPALKEKLARLRRPVLAVRVDERHVGGQGAGVNDPAVETELRRMLLGAGFTVIDGGERQQVEGGVEVIVGGEAFSEFAARIGNLTSCSARVELKVTERKTGEVLFSGRETTRAAALSENIAAKNALEKAGRALGVRLVQHFADTLKPAEAPPKPQQ